MSNYILEAFSFPNWWYSFSAYNFIQQNVFKVFNKIAIKCRPILCLLRTNF